MELLMSRGRDTAGYAVIDPRSSAVRLVRGKPEDVIRALEADESVDRKLVILHCRARPLTEETSVAQPLLWRNIVVAAAGIIENDADFKDSDAPQPWIDSYAFCKVITDEPQATMENLAKLVGSYSVIAVNLARPSLMHIIKGSQPLAVAHRDGEAIAVASEASMLEALGFTPELPAPGTYIAFDLEACRCTWRSRFCISTSAPVLEPSPSRAVVLCSGGLDSAVAACIAAEKHSEVVLLFVDYGQPAAEMERKAVHAIAEKIGAKVCEVKLPGLDTRGLRSPPTGPHAAETLKRWVPARNLVLLAHAIALAEQIGAEVVYTGFNLEEACVFPDNTTEAVELLDRAAKWFVASGRIRIEAPLARMMKRDIVKLAIEYGVLDITWSCDKPGPEPCGECEGCWLRRKALEELGRG